MLEINKIPYANNEVLAPVSHQYTGELGDALDKLNTRYSFVTMDGRHKAFDNKEKMFIEIESVQRKHNKTIQHNDKSIKLTSLWLGEEHLRREFDKVVFKPYSSIDDVISTHFNQWHGWAIQPAEHTNEEDFEKYVQPWLSHIKHIFCSGNDEQFDYFIKWIAHMFQKPYEKPGVAIVIKSGQGFGKGLLTTMLQKIVGDNYTIRVSDSNQVAGGFSGHMNNKILINLDEATWGGDKKSQGRLKALITEQRLTLEAKHKNADEIDHFGRFLITTNSSYPVPIEIDDRRFFVPDVVQAKPSREVFKELVKINSSENALKHIFRYFLMVDLEDFLFEEFPHSETRKSLQKESVNHNDIYTAFMLACYEGEEAATALCQQNISASQLYECFNEWKSHSAFKNTPSSITALGTALNSAGFIKRRANNGYKYSIKCEDVENYLKSKKII